MTVVGKEDDQEQTLNEGEGEERSGNEEEECLEEEQVTKNLGQIQTVGTEEEKEDVEANDEEEVLKEE